MSKGNNIAGRFWGIFLSFILAMGMLPFSPQNTLAADVTYKNGIYEGTGRGRNGEIVLRVTVEDNKITQIEEVSQEETPNYWENAKQLFDTVIENNSVEVDGISGATLSSDGIKQAISDALSQAVDAGIFASGKGTAARPYLIETAQQLSAFADSVDAGTNYADEYIALDNDIDLSDIPNWNPIGAEGKASANDGKLFAGNFDGRGYTISGLTISADYAEEASIGLFSTLADTARVHDVILQNVSIEAAVAEDATWMIIRAGGIAGDTARTSGDRAAIIDGCAVDGIVSVNGADGQGFGGGIIGRAFTKAAIINCVSDTAVTVDTTDGYNTAYAGGIAGMTGNNTVVANCASFGKVVAKNQTSIREDVYVGGISGMLSSKTYNVYAMGDIAASKNSAVKKTYAGVIAGQAAGSSSGAIIYYASDATVTVDSEPVDTVAWAENIGQISSDTTFGKAKEEMAEASFAETLNANLGAVTNALNEPELAMREWKLDNGRVVPSDIPWVSGEIDDSIFASGTGTEEDPYIIMTKDQLKAFAGSLGEKIDYKNTYVQLGDDIDISGENWSPIGGSFYRFDGDFDGNGKTISGLTEGSATAPLRLDGSNAYIGLFGWLNENAHIHDLTLDKVAIYTHSPGSAYVGGIAGRMNGTETENDYRGTGIDSCVVKGVIRHDSEKGTSFVGGICGHVFKGTIINTMTDVKLTAKELSGELIEVGGIAGLLNRGLVANCYALGSITGSGYRNTQYDIEGMACIGNIAAVNGGYIVNCYGEGDVEALEYSIDTGIITGWVTGIAKVYNCWYNQNAKMVIDGRTVKPVDPFGETVAGGVSDEWGFKFPGSLVEKIEPYTPGSEGATKVAEGLNASFAAFPIDIETLYGLKKDSLRHWSVQDGHAVLSDTRATVNYVQPEVEKNITEQEDPTLMDGIWYGRSDDKNTIVAITVADGAVTKTEVQRGDTSGKSYDDAVARARFKALYGDTTDYSQADTSRFRGSGTQSNPYQIENEKQLRYLAASINEDVDWADTYFKQTCDITVTGGDWKPIGWGIFADADGDGFGQDVVALYPFRGHYDGDNYAIKGLKAGSPTNPVSGNWMGLFGIIQGGFTDNADVSGERATLKNIRVENISFYIENRWRSYIGGLVGNAQGGFTIDHCSVTGTIHSRSDEDFAYAGGLSGSLMYGGVTNCWTDVDATAWSGKNYSYAAGMSAVTNRATIVNSYTLGDVHADADQTNRAEAGGFIALDGGICINCYAKGNVEVISKYSMYMGGFVGMAASSCEHRQCYYNTDASQKVAGQEVAQKQYAGKFVNESAEANAQNQTAVFMSSDAFKELLESNRKNIGKTLNQVRSALGADESGSSRYHSVYYGGDGSDLKQWVCKSGVVGFEEGRKNNSGKGGSGGGASAVSQEVKDVIQLIQAIGTVNEKSENAIVAARNAYDKLTESQKQQVSNYSDLTAAEKAFEQMQQENADTKNPSDAHIENSKFVDVPKDSYFAQAVEWAIKNKVTGGVDENHFAPNGLCTRAQVVTFLWRNAGSPQSTIEKNPFRDLDENAYYYPAVLWAFENGIAKGTDKDMFSPNTAVTRGQAVVFIARYAKAEQVEWRAVFTDVQQQDYFANSVIWALDNGITKGTTKTTFSPHNICTRGQIVSFLYRYEQSIKND